MRVALLLLILLAVAEAGVVIRRYHVARRALITPTAALLPFESVLTMPVSWAWTDVAAFVVGLDTATAATVNDTGILCGGCSLVAVTKAPTDTAFVLSCFFDNGTTTETSRTAFVRALLNHVVGISSVSTVLVGANSVFRIHGVTTEYVNGYWHLDRLDQRPNTPDNLYRYYATGLGVRIYTIDTGVRGSHPEFAPLGRAQTIANTIDGSALDDGHGHGTHVASIAAGVVGGFAKRATVHGVKALDDAGTGTAYSVISAILVVQSECSATPNSTIVINLSISGPYSASVNAALLNLMATCSVVVTVAAGNSAADACGASPASTPGALTFGATWNSDAWASFSNYGSCVALSAPGVNIVGAYYLGGNITMSGTSMAAPCGAGVAAITIEQLQASGWSATVSETGGARVRSILLAQAIPYAPKNILFAFFYVNASNNYGLSQTAVVPPPPGVTPTPTPSPPPTPTPTPSRSLGIRGIGSLVLMVVATTLS